MTPSELRRLKSGTIYRVEIKGMRRKVRRIFKWVEERFDDLSCGVFSARVVGPVSVSWNAKTKSLSMQGRHLPTSEVSVPHYDIVSCETEGHQ
jgi:hypothetical protein